MRRVWLAVVLAALSASSAAADPTELGAFVGPRVFSTDSALGFLEDETFHPNLRTTVGFGVRVARSFGFEWLYPELEVALVPAKTTEEGGATSASVVWLEPRVHIRIDMLPRRRLIPFALVGGGAPVSFSSARMTFNSGAIGEGYVGGGIRFDTYKGFGLRFDARFSVQPGGEGLLAYEGDFNIGVELVFGGPKRRPPQDEEEKVVVVDPNKDTDGDSVPDKADNCPDRAEDTDGFDDADGCPDIDNDNDRVLDIADKCPTESENLNGFADDDGCIDAVPPEIESLRGTIEGLIYGEGETAVRDSAQKAIQQIAKTLLAQPSVKIILVGHTDDREAKAFVMPPAKDQPAPDLTTIATDLARARAEAVRQALVAAGLSEARVVVDGVGAEEPVTDNNSAKGRLANRRVEIKLFVPR
jgi:outer membrane protein OmpA-like peptidoglycan-associated protein